MDKTYKVIAVCNNCDFCKMVEIEQGTMVSEISCPRCGCKTLDSHRKHFISPSEEILKLSKS